jgi:hypothetical protein
MKMISRRIWVAFLGLGVLGLIGPSAGADEMADWMAEQRRQNDEYNRQWQEWREAADRAYQQAQQEQAARDRAYQEAQAEQAARDRYYYEQQQQRAAEERAQADREAWDKYWRDVQADRDAADRAYREAQQTQAERDAWYKSQEETRQYWEDLKQQEEYDKWSRNLWGDADWSSASDSTQRSVRQPAGLVILNPFALEKMKPEDQERVRQEANRMGQPIRQDSSHQAIENPFVPARK